jgi:hypothetical protein
MPHPATITTPVLEKIIAFLAPLFLDTVAGNLPAARQAASDTLLSYGTLNDRQARLAALSIAFSFGALDAMSRATDTTLPVSQVIRLRGNANALNRAVQQNENRLEKLLKHQGADEAASDETLPASTGIADLLAFARPGGMAKTSPAPVAPISRQQRRAAERQAQKARLREEEKARLAQRASARMARAEEARLTA